MQNAPERMNDSGTCTPTRTKSVPPCSLIVLARQLTRSPGVPPRLASLLLQQTYSYDANPEAMRPLILATIERIEGVRA